MFKIIQIQGNTLIHWVREGQNPQENHFFWNKTGNSHLAPNFRGNQVHHHVYYGNQDYYHLHQVFTLKFKIVLIF